MFQKRSNSLLAKQGKNGEQPNKTKQRTTNVVFSKKRPLAEIQYENIGVDFPEEQITQTVYTAGQPIFQNSGRKEVNLETPKPTIQTPKPREVQPEAPQKPAPIETQDFRRVEQLVTLDANSQGCRAPSLEEYSRYKNHELNKKEHADSVNEILNSFTQLSFDELKDQVNHQFHPNMIQATGQSQPQFDSFEECSMASFLQLNLFCCVKDSKVFIYNQKELLFQMATNWPVRHVFFHQDILYVSTTEELICIKVSESQHTGLKVEQEQVIGVSAEKVINTSAIVNGKIWVGMSQAQELQVDTKRKSFLFCKTSAEMAVQLPKKSFLGSLTSFFTSKDKVTQMYDIPCIDLAVVLLENSSSYNKSEVQLFDRKSLKMCGKFTVQWLTKQLETFMARHGIAQMNVNLQTEILNISGKFFDSKMERHLVITFKNGVQINLYLAPARPQTGTNSIGEDDMSIVFVQSSPMEGCLAWLDYLQSQIAPKYKPPLLSMRCDLVLQPPFKNDLCLAQYTILSFKSSKLLQVYVVEQEERLYLITQLQQRGQAISSIQTLKGSVFFDVLIDDQRHHQTVKILTDKGLEQFQQKTLRDHLGSYLILASQVLGGLQKGQQLNLDFEELLKQYPLHDIFAVLIDFFISDPVQGQPIYHDVNVQNFYFNQIEPAALKTIKLQDALRRESLGLFESLLSRMRTQLDKSRWEICCDVVHEVLQAKTKDLLLQYPFKLNSEGISPELLKESLINIGNIIEFLQHLKCQESNNCIMFCQKLREVCLFVLFTLRGTSWDVSAVINQVFDEDRKLVMEVSMYELISIGLESLGLQIFLENYLTFHKHDQRVCEELISNCCQQFLQQDFFILSLAKQKLMRTGFQRQEVARAVQDLCTLVNKTDLLATFDLLLENFEIYGLDPSLSYLQCFIDTKFVHLQWSEANQRELKSIDAVKESRLQAMDILLELVEELGFRIQGKSSPQSNLESIRQFRQKLEKNKNEEQLKQSLTYLVLRIERIDDQWLHNTLFARLIELGLSQYIRKCSSKHLVQFFKDKIGKQEETADGVQIIADNFILLERFEEGYLYMADQIGSSRHLTNVSRPTGLEMPIKLRIGFIQKAELCLDNIESSTQKQKWAVEICHFRRLVTLQAEIYDQLHKAQIEPTEEELFLLKQLQNSLFSADELLRTCNDNSLYAEMLQAILLKVDPSGVALQGYTAQEIEDQVLQCYSGLVEKTQANEIPDILEPLYQIQKAVGKRMKQAGLLQKVLRNLPIDFFPLNQILALVVSQNKVTERLMLVFLVHLSMPPAEIIDALIRISTPDNNALIAVQPVVSLLLKRQKDGAQVKSNIDQIQLKQLRDMLVEGFIQNEVRHSVAVVNQAQHTVADIDKLIFL